MLVLTSKEDAMTGQSASLTSGDRNASSTGDRRVGPWIVQKVSDGVWAVARTDKVSFHMTRNTKERAAEVCAANNKFYFDGLLQDAAPELLAACQDCLENRGDWMARMSAAIAKAAGDA